MLFTALITNSLYSASLVSNEVVSGTDGRIVTGINYTIGANTQRSGYLYMEANPNNERIRPTRYDENSSDARDWHWSLSHVGGGFYTIGANTQRSGYLYMEANPNNERIRPTRYDRNASDARDWHWTLSHVGDGFYTIGANTQRSGYLYMEANPNNERIRPTRYDRNASDARDWHWSFTPISYKLSAVIEGFNYDGVDVDALITGSEGTYSQFESDTVENTQRQGEINIQRNYSRDTTHTCTWSFSSSDTTRLSQNITVQVNYASPFGIGSTVGYNFGHESERIFSASTTHGDSMTRNESSTVNYTIPCRTRLTTITKRIEKTVDMPFSARCIFSARADRVRTDGTIAPMAELDRPGVLALLRHKGLLSERESFQEDNTIIIRGILKTQYRLTETAFREESLD